jgi:hypothetical protein
MATKAWCLVNLLDLWPKEVLALSSPNCNSLNCYIYSICRKDVKKDSCNTAASLMMLIMEVMDSLPRGTMAKTCRRSMNRTEVIMEAGSNFL